MPFCEALTLALLKVQAVPNFWGNTRIVSWHPEFMNVMNLAHE